MKNAHLRRSPHPSLLRRTYQYASLLRITGALHLGIFDQPVGDDFLKKDAIQKEVVNKFRSHAASL